MKTIVLSFALLFTNVALANTNYPATDIEGKWKLINDGQISYNIIDIQGSSINLYYSDNSIYRQGKVAPPILDGTPPPVDVTYKGSFSYKIRVDEFVRADIPYTCEYTETIVFGVDTQGFLQIKVTRKNTPCENKFGLPMGPINLKFKKATTTSNPSVKVTNATKVPKISAKYPTEITANSALVAATYNNTFGNTIKAQGLCYSAVENPVITRTDCITATDNDFGKNFSKSLDNLKPNTTYYLRAYAINNNNGIGYSKQIKFSTKSLPTDDKKEVIAPATNRIEYGCYPEDNSRAQGAVVLGITGNVDYTIAVLDVTTGFIKAIKPDLVILNNNLGSSAEITCTVTTVFSDGRTDLLATKTITASSAGLQTFDFSDVNLGSGIKLSNTTGSHVEIKLSADKSIFGWRFTKGGRITHVKAIHDDKGPSNIGALFNTYIFCIE